RIDFIVAGFVIAALLLVPSRAAQAAGAEPAAPVVSAAQLIARARSGRADVPRVELAARLKAAGLQATYDYAVMRDNAAREPKGRPDGVGSASEPELARADDAIGAFVAVLQGSPPPHRTFAE